MNTNTIQISENRLWLRVLQLRDIIIVVGEVAMGGHGEKERQLKLMTTRSYTVCHDYSEICGRYSWIERVLWYNCLNYSQS